MHFNPSKCKVINIVRKNISEKFDYHINETVLENVDQFCDLGIQVTRKLSWNSYIKYIVGKPGVD